MRGGARTRDPWRRTESDWIKWSAWIGPGIVLLVASGIFGCRPTPEEQAASAAQEYVQRGDLALARGQAVAAEAEYQQALALGDDWADAWLGVARALAVQRRDEEALAAYDALGRLDPDRLAAVHSAEVCPVLVRSADGRLLAGRGKAALELAQRARREGCETDIVAPTLSRALAAEADALRNRDPAGAADLYLAAAAADSGDAALFARAAALLLAEGRRDEALSVLSEALRLHSDDTALQQLMVDALAQRPAAVDPFDAPAP